MTSSRYDVILWRHLQRFDFSVFLLTLARYCDFLKHFHTKPATYVKLLCFGFQKTQTELKNDFSLDSYCKLKKCVFPKNRRILKIFWWRQQKMAAILENFFYHIVAISQVILVPSFMPIALSYQKLLRGGRICPPPE